MLKNGAKLFLQKFVQTLQFCLNFEPKVESFILESGELDEDSGLDASKFLLSSEIVDDDHPDYQLMGTDCMRSLVLAEEMCSGKAVLKSLASNITQHVDEAAAVMNRAGPKFLDEGGDVTDPDQDGQSLIVLACSAGYYELAELLLNSGAYIEDRNIKDQTPLMGASEHGHLEIVKLLLRHGADVHAKTAQEKKLKGAKLKTQELKSQQDPNNVPAIACPDGHTALMFACANGHYEIVVLLLEQGARVEDHNENGHTPLMEAASSGHVNIAKLLVERGASINTHSNEFKESALTLACYKGHLEMVRFLLEAGADREHKTDEMHTALMEASMDGHVDVARLLLDSGAQVNMPADSFESPLTLAACGGHTDLAILLLERGANIEEVNDEGYTPLMEAAREGHEDMVNLLLTQGADFNAQTEETQETALTLAACGGFLECAESLVKAGADVELGASTPLMEAAQEGHLELVRYLIAHGANVNSTTATGDTALTYACENGHTDVADLLLQAGAKLEHESEGGRTPLMKAARAGHLCTVQFLISKGANVNKQTTNNDHNPLSLACAGGHIQIVELLLAHGADPTHKLKDNSTMLIEAAKGGHTSVVQLLLDYPNGMLSSPPPPPDITPIANPMENSEAARVPPHGYPILFPEPEHYSLDGPLTLDLRTSSNNLTFSPAAPQSQPLYHPSPPQQSQLQPPPSPQQPQQPQQQKPIQQSVITTASTVVDNCKSRTGKPKQAKTVIKQSVQQPFQVQGSQTDSKTDHLPGIDDINLRNLVFTEQQQQQQQQQQLQLQQQLIHQHSQQQFVLSEFTQNLTLRGTQYCEGAIAGIMHAMGGIKLTSDSTQTHAIPMYDPVTVGQALLQQQLQQQKHLVQHQHFTQVIQQEAKRQSPQPQHPQQQQQLQQQQQQQQEHFDKNGKALKVKTAKVQQQSLLQTSQPSLTSLQSQQAQQLMKQQFATCGEACTLVGTNLPIDGTGVIMASPAFPVSIAVSPVSLSTPVTIATSCGTTFTHNIAINEGLMVASPARTLHETLGDIVTAPTTQLAGNQLNLLHQAPHCSETCLNMGTTNGKTRSLSMSSLPGAATVSASVPLTFCNFAPSVTPCVPIQVSASNECISHHLPHLQHATTAPSTPAPPLYGPLEVNSQTDSNHDTALTLACAGGHEELVSLLLSRNADIEHRDKKGFTPLMLAATAGHAGVVEILLNHAADLEAQSERTKDTALSLACSGGRYEVVDILLARGANKEHRNVSDYTPLSLAASGGYVNIIKLLLSHGAEINSRTGSKLGISPLMLASMNGHTQAVRLLLDMGSDINAQIETNRNTALTLACFQGRHEVVSLLLDRKANVEHRAKTGLTPLMEAASGGYVEVGKVLIDKGADVNAPPVPSSRDTALTIAADKGHYRFVQLLLERDAIVDVKNKKGNSPLWLAANGGHLEVVQLLYANNADIDSQDNRKVSCLMAAFRRGHVKVVKWMVKHVSQFPSDQEMARFMSTVTDKAASPADLLKKCSQCVDVIRIAKERQAAEANKNANILLEELDLERCREESRKAAAARRRERKRRKKREKQEQLRAAKAAAEESKKPDKNDYKQSLKRAHNLSDQSDAEDEDEEDDEDDEEDEEEEQVLPPLSIKEESKCPPDTISSPCKSSNSSAAEKPKETSCPEPEPSQYPVIKCNSESQVDKRREREKSKTQEKNKRNANKSVTVEVRPISEILVAEKHLPKSTEQSVIVNSSSTLSACNRVNKKKVQKHEAVVNCTTVVTTSTLKSIISTMSSATSHLTSTDTKSQSSVHSKQYKHDGLVNGISGNSIADYEELCSFLNQSASLKNKKNSVEKLTLEPYGELSLDLPTEVALTAGLRSPSLQHSLKSSLNGNTASPKKWQKRDEGWKEVVRSKLFNRSKKVSVPANAISRVIGRGGMNINAIREGSGAHIEVEKQKGQGDRNVIIRGSAESTRLAQQLISALIKEPEKELSEILTRCGVNRVVSSLNSAATDSAKTSNSINNLSLSTAAQLSSISNFSKNVSRQNAISKALGNTSTSIAKITPIPPPSLPANATPPFTNQFRSVLTNTQNIRQCIPISSATTPPFLNNAHSAWTGVVASGKVPPNVPRPSVPVGTASSALIVSTSNSRVSTSSAEKNSVNRQLFPPDKKNSQLSGTTTSTKTTVSYTMAVIAQGKHAKGVPVSVTTVSTKVTNVTDTKVSTISPISVERAGSAPPTSASQLPVSHSSASGLSAVQPFTSCHSPKVTSQSPTSQSSNSTCSVRGSVSHALLHSKPFNTVASSQGSAPSNPSISSAEAHTITSSQSSMAQEYTPFSNIFAKVAQSVWGQKDKEASKPNFASVAASGITSVASPVQNSNPVQSSLTLNLPLNSEPDLVVDAAKAPGYRGNLHISPSASSSSSVTTQLGMSNATFGPIGSGPRSAPCTPPLGPIGPPSSSASSTRRSTPPAVPSPPPPHLSRSVPESQNAGEVPRSATGGLPPSHMSSQASEALFHHQNLEMSFHPNRLQTYPMAASMASPGGTNTTFSQHSPLPSVGTILLSGESNGPMQVVQSNLNPNAPDFSSRNSLLMTSQGPPMHHLPRLPSGPNNFQENSVAPHLAQFRPILASEGSMNPNFSLHAMANAQAQAALNRFPFHHMPNHQQQAADFNNPNGSSSGLGLNQGNDGMPLLNMVAGYPHPSAVVPGNGNIPHHFPGLQSMMSMRANQRSASTTPSVGTSSKDEGSPVGPMSPNSSPQGSNLPSPTGIQENPNPAGTIGEDRKLPRPIGMERAQQRKNPVFGGVSDEIWAFSTSGRSEIPADWVHSMQGAMQQDESAMQQSVHNFTANRFADVLPLENNHALEQTYQQAMASGYPFMNGLPPPHLMAPQLYQNNTTSQVEASVEMWGVHQKANQSGDSLPQNMDQKASWPSWSQHQA